MADRKKVYLAFALGDKEIINKLTKEKLATDQAYEFIYTTSTENEDENWRIKTRDKIKKADGVIVLLSQRTLKSDKQLDEVGLAVNENKKIVQMRLFPNVRTQLGGWPIQALSQDHLVKFINSL